MTSPLKPRPGILDISPYVGGESKVPGVNRIIKLASNESPIGASERAIEEYRSLAGELNRYPDGAHADLRAAIAARHGLDLARVACGCGSDEMLSLVARGYAGPGDEVIHTVHGFALYPIFARSVGAIPVAAPETNLTTDVDAILARVTPRTRIVYIANPNNPTGTYISAAELERLRAGLRDDIVLVIDAAYAEYVTADDYDPGVRLVESTENTVMTRTFSKIHGLAALRLGWAYAPLAVIDVFDRIRGPFNVSAPALAAGVAAIEDTAFVERSVRHNSEWLPRVAEALRGIGLTVPPSVGNFLLVRFPDEPGRDAASAIEFLKGRGIIPRRMTGYGLPDSIRLSIGLADENEAVIEALTAFMGR